jgi:glycine dehydrogenase subunit 1
MTAPTHPYMANSTPRDRRAMLDALGRSDVEELFAQIPARHRLARPLTLADGVRSEADLSRQLLDLLARNQDCETTLSFLGAGCWPHYVPAVCDEIISRTELSTACWGSSASDFGAKQMFFEFTSQLAELVDLDFASLPSYSWGCAAGSAIRMGARMTGRDEVVIAGPIDSERLAVIDNYCQPRGMRDHIEIRSVECDWDTGLVSPDQLRKAVGDRTAAVYFENPSFLGTIEAGAASLVEVAHAAGAEAIVGVDPISLGVLAAPGSYGADIAVGPLQSLGLHMNCGGSTGGFIASGDGDRYVSQYPTLLFNICDTIREGEQAFSLSRFEQNSYGSRDEANDWTGTSVNLWAIAASVYMSLLGPSGFAEIGDVILSRGAYAAQRLTDIPGVELSPSAPFFREFALDLRGTGCTVPEINDGLLTRGIFGGVDLGRRELRLADHLLVCVTEKHTQSDIDRLVEAVGEVVAR